MIMFNSTAPSALVPVGGPNRIAAPGSGAKIALVCALSLCLMLIAFSARERRLTVALALLAFALVIGSSACGGGSGSSTPPPSGGTPTGTTAIVVTAKSGSIQRSVSVLLTVN